jgi:hypothetical protein
MLAAASQPQLQQQAGCSPRAHRPEAETQAGRPDVRGSAAAADAPAAAVPGSPQAPGPATPLNSPFEHAGARSACLHRPMQPFVSAGFLLGQLQHLPACLALLLCPCPPVPAGGTPAARTLCPSISLHLTPQARAAWPPSCSGSADIPAAEGAAAGGCTGRCRRRPPAATGDPARVGAGGLQGSSAGCRSNARLPWGHAGVCSLSPPQPAACRAGLVITMS